MKKKGFDIADHDAQDEPALEIAEQRMQSSAQARNPDRFAQSRAHVNDSPFARPAIGASRVGAPAENSLNAPVSEFLDNPFNARTIYRDERVAELAANIAVEGQITPVPVCEVATARRLVHEAGGTSKAGEVLRQALEGSTAKYLMLGGHYRKRSVSRLGDRPLMFNLVEVKSLLGLYLKSYAENDEREATSPLDDAMAWANLLELGLVKNQEQIAEATGKPRTTVVKTLALLKLPADVQTIFREQPENYTLTAGYLLTQLATLLPLDRLVALATQIVRDEVSTRDLEAEQVRLAAGTPARKPRDMSRQHKILARDGTGPIGTIKDWDNGRIQLDVLLTDPKEKEELLLTLKERFGVTVDTNQLSLKG